MQDGAAWVQPTRLLTLFPLSWTPVRGLGSVLGCLSEDSKDLPTTATAENMPAAGRPQEAYFTR